MCPIPPIPRSGTTMTRYASNAHSNNIKANDGNGSKGKPPIPNLQTIPRSHRTTTKDRRKEEETKALCKLQTERRKKEIPNHPSCSKRLHRQRRRRHKLQR